ncbi:MAG: hypothetical protein CME68_00965 [Halobacteriovoraceae bacterium]|nr:hypothetical protein [Halobacteriovoraceae bacterium]
MSPKRNIFLVLFLFIFQAKVFALPMEAVKSNNLFAKESLALNLTQEGLDFVSKVLLDKLSEDLNGKKIDDINVNIPFVANIKVEQIKFNLSLDYLKLVPHETGLKILIGLKNVHLGVGHFRAFNPFLPNVGTSCFNTSIELGNGSLAPIEMDLDVAVESQELKLKLNDFYFHLNNKQYVSFGPRECHGVFGIRDYMTQLVVKEVLSSARVLINTGTHLAVKALFKKLEEGANSFLKEKTFPIEIPFMSHGDSPSLSAQLVPEEATFGAGKMGVVLSVKLLNQVSEKSLSNIENLDANFLRYFSVSIKPELINILLEGLRESGSLPEIELKEDMHEVIGALVHRDELSNFLPDLEKAKLDEDKLKLFVSLRKAPSLSIGEGGDLLLNAPGLDLKFYAKRNQKWEEYFTFEFDMKLNFDIKIESENLDLSFAVESLNLNGRWASSYEPQDKTFYREDAEESFKSLFYMISTELEDSSILKVPSLEVGDREITFKNLKLDDGFIHLDIIPSN